MSHTPGPWIVSRGPLTLCEPLDRSKLSELHVDAEGGGVALVCHRGSSPFSAAYPQREANARLIAAAPDLLELARLVVDYFGEDELDPFLDADIRLRDTARTLIAKAEGRAEGV